MNSKFYKPLSEAQLRKKYYTLLQLGKSQLRMDDEFYYGIWLPEQKATIDPETGRYSAKTMTLEQLRQAVEHMVRLGFKIKSSNDKSSRKLAGDPQSTKIRALWLEMHNQGIVRNSSEASLNAYVKRLTGIEALQWLTTEQASGVIEALKRWQKRAQQS